VFEKLIVTEFDLFEVVIIKCFKLLVYINDV